ncbi:hypothetical protein TKK_0009862 [Trichogramma kaykai]
MITTYCELMAQRDRANRRACDSESVRDIMNYHQLKSRIKRLIDDIKEKYIVQKLQIAQDSEQKWTVLPSPALTDDSIQQVLQTPLNTAKPIFQLCMAPRSQAMQVITSSRSKAIGPDHLCSDMLKRTTLLSADPLLEIFNQSIATHTFPSSGSKPTYCPYQKKKVIVAKHLEHKASN